MLCKLGNDYLKKTEGCESAIFEFLASDPEAEFLYVKLIEEMERCILTYFAFHWSNSSSMINQVCHFYFFIFLFYFITFIVGRNQW